MFRRSRALEPHGSDPRTEIEPLVQRKAPMRKNRMVVFPAPLGPSKPVICPEGMLKLTPLITRLRPYEKSRLSATTALGCRLSPSSGKREESDDNPGEECEGGYKPD